MTAALRKFLVLDVAAGEPGFFQIANCLRDTFAFTKAGVGIDNRRNSHRLRNITGKRYHFVSAQQSNVRNARSRIRHSGPAHINRIEPSLLNLARHRSVRHPRNHHRAF